MLIIRQALGRVASVIGFFVAGLLVAGCSGRDYGSNPAEPERVAQAFKNAKAINWTLCPESLDSWTYAFLPNERHINEGGLLGPKMLPADLIEKKLSRHITITTSFLAAVEHYSSACDAEQQAARNRSTITEAQAAAVKAVLAESASGAKAGLK